MSFPQNRGKSNQSCQAARALPKSQGKRIIGIDLATTRACVASATVPLEESNQLHNKKALPPRVEVFTNWPTDYRTQTNPPTALYYGEHGGLPTTGNALSRIVEAKGRPGQAGFDTERYFRLWKLMFHENQSDATTEEIQAGLQQKLDHLGLTRDDLLRGWVAATYKQLFLEGVDGQYRLNHWDERYLDLEIVVAVPPGRSVVAHEAVLQGFIQKPILAHQVSLISEPEAMFRSWVNEGVHTQDWKVGTRYLVGDGGGGTCCLVRFRLDRLDPLGFTQEFESESIICGAETISNSFEKLASASIPPNLKNRAYVLDNLRRQFDEICKHHFGDDDETLYSFEKPWDRNSNIDFSCDQIAACFDQCVKKIVTGIRHQLVRGGTSVNCLVLGGGLFDNTYVMKVIKREFPNLKIRELSKDKSHVAKGAVLTRLHSRNTFITSRPITSSKALITWKSINSTIRNSPLYSLLDTYFDELNGVEYFYAAQWLVKQGEEAMLKHADDIYEVASESSFETARTRVFDPQGREKFTETIVTVNYHPGDADWAAFRKTDNRLIDQNGNLIPDYKQSEIIKWNPLEIGVSVGNIQPKRSPHGSFYKVIHYSIQMQMREVGTKYWIKAWSPSKKNGQNMTVVFSDEIERQSLFGPHEIKRSLNLSESRKLGTGVRADDDPSEEPELPAEATQLSRKTSSTHQPILSSPQDKRIPGQSQPPKTASLPVPVTTIEESSPEHSSRQPQIGTFSIEHSRSSIGPNSRKRSASTQGDPRRQDFSRSPLQDLRAPQRQSTECTSEYALGARRNNGGCWTCRFRNLKCDKGEPACLECANLGLKCEYGCPIWWVDERLREEQKEINKGLIRNHKAREKSKKQRAERPPRPRPRAKVSIFKSVHKPHIPRDTDRPELIPQRSRQFRPWMVTSNNLPSSDLPSNSTFNQSELLSTTPGQSEARYPPGLTGDEDLYGASPPRQQLPCDTKEEVWEDTVRRSNRRRTHYIPDNMRDWDEIDREEGFPSESGSKTTESHEEYIEVI